MAVAEAFLARAEPPLEGCIVLDVTMPGLDGFEVTRALRENAATRTMPVILLTARAQATDVAQGMAAGADEYVKKPFEAADLIDRVERLLRDVPARLLPR